MTPYVIVFLRSPATEIKTFLRCSAKGKVVLVHTMKACGEWHCSSTHSEPRILMEPRVPVALLPREVPPVPSEWNIGWAAKRDLTISKREKSLALPGNRRRFPRLSGPWSTHNIENALPPPLLAAILLKFLKKFLCVDFFTSHGWFITSLFLSCLVITS